MKSENFNRTYSTIANTLMVIIEASLCLIVGALPLVVVAFAVNDFDYWALYIVAAALSMPGIAALFAIFRDQPTLLSMNASVRTQVWLDNESDPDFPPEWIAAPYVYPDASVMFIKSYFKAYARLFKRSLGIGVFYWFLVFCFGYDILIVLQLSWGGFIVPMLVICILMALQSMMVSLVLAVEYPKANMCNCSRTASSYPCAVSLCCCSLWLRWAVMRGRCLRGRFPYWYSPPASQPTWYGLVPIGRQACCSRPWLWRAATSASSTCTMRRITAPRRRVPGSEAPRITSPDASRHHISPTIATRQYHEQ